MKSILKPIYRKITEEFIPSIDQKEEIYDPLTTVREHIINEVAGVAQFKRISIPWVKQIYPQLLYKK